LERSVELIASAIASHHAVVEQLSQTGANRGSAQTAERAQSKDRTLILGLNRITRTFLELHVNTLRATLDEPAGENMPTHAILVTYKDMEPKVLPEFITKARGKYGDDGFKQLYFDAGEGLKGKLHDAVWDVPDEDRLKIFISGHGGTGIQYITADDQVRKQTVDDLARLLHFALSDRATSPQNSKNTEVNMVSCLFGRTPIGGMEQCPAVRLHQELGRRHVYVDLVARTQSIVVASPEWAQQFAAPQSGSRTTVSVVEDEIQELISPKKRPGHAQRLKTQFSKIRCTYRGTAPVVLIKDYENQEPWINSETRQGRYILWADNVVNEIIKYVKPSFKEAVRVAKARGPEDIEGRVDELADPRHKELLRVAIEYDMHRQHDILEEKMRRILLPAFSKHRGLGPIHFGLPKTAQLIKRLLDAYPDKRPPAAPGQ
jgi:hypothetical protein